MNKEKQAEIKEVFKKGGLIVVRRDGRITTPERLKLELKEANPEERAPEISRIRISRWF